MTAFMEQMIARVRSAWTAHSHSERKLRLRESLSLGERRFVAVIECDGRRFLVGGGKDSMRLIARLPEESRLQEESE